MTITFHCPGCGRLCAFRDKFAGRRARCTSCQQLFIIPPEEGRKPEKIKVKARPEGAISGFYRAVFVDSWKAFTNLAGITGFVFITIVACFKFFISHMNYEISLYSPLAAGRIDIPLPFGRVMALACWGCMFWYYMEIIYWTAFDVDELPDIGMGRGIELLGNIFRPLYAFAVSLLVTEVPFIVVILMLMKAGVEWSWPLRTIAIVGLFGFPMAVLTASVGRDLVMLLRPDYLVLPIIKAFRPYLVTAVLVILTATILWKAVAYSPQMLEKGPGVVALHLAANIGVQVIAIISARSVGLFCRHYGCYLPW